jgi:hypothetical protein
MCAVKFPLVSMGGRAEGLACADPGARTHIGASRKFRCNEFHKDFMILLNQVSDDQHCLFKICIYLTLNI